MGFVDVDTHIIEDDTTWDYLDPTDRIYRPTTAEFVARSGQLEDIPQRYWLAGDTYTRRHPGDARAKGVGREFSPDVTFLENPSARIADMDMLGTDLQVLISTFFLSTELGHPFAEAALTRSFNRWVADRTAGYRDRLRWLVVPPTQTMARAMEELEFGASNGAAGVLLNGFTLGRYLDDPYFYPIYEKAQDLDLPICVHVGVHMRWVPNLAIGSLIPTPAAFTDHLGAEIKGFWAVLTSDFYKRFPRLRWTFLEGGSSWVPAICQQQQRLASTSNTSAWAATDRGTGLVVTKIDVAEEMARRNMFVACESDEDLPYLVKQVGPGCLVYGSDYCHNDKGSDPLGQSKILARDDLSHRTAIDIVDTNGRTLFGVPAGFTPTGVTSATRSPAALDPVGSETS